MVMSIPCAEDSDGVAHLYLSHSPHDYVIFDLGLPSIDRVCWMLSILFQLEVHNILDFVDSVPT